MDQLNIYSETELVGLSTIKFCYNGMNGTAMVTDWKEKNMRIVSMQMEYPVSGTNFTDAAESLFDYALDIADLREQDHFADAQDSEDEE